MHHHVFWARLQPLSEPNEYFDQEDFSSKDAPLPLGVEFRFKDTFTKITHEVTYTGQEILGWFSPVPNAPKYNWRLASAEINFKSSF